MHYKYCPECGEKLVDKPAGDDGNVPYCEACQKYWFDTFASCVIMLVANEYNEIAMLKQSYLSSDHWTYVAGYIKPGENAEETAIREIEEELGLRAERLEYAGTYWFQKREQLMHGFVAFTKKADFKLSEEVDDAIWVPYKEAPTKMFPERPGNTQRPLYRKYLELIKNRM